MKKNYTKGFVFIVAFILCFSMGGNVYVKAAGDDVVPQTIISKTSIGNIIERKITEKEVVKLSNFIAKRGLAALDVCNRLLGDLGYSENELSALSDETKIKMFSGGGEIVVETKYLSTNIEGETEVVSESEATQSGSEIFLPILEGGGGEDPNDSYFIHGDSTIKITTMCTYLRSHSEKGWYNVYSLYFWFNMPNHHNNTTDISLYPQNAGEVIWPGNNNNSDYSTTMIYDLGTTTQRVTKTNQNLIYLGDGISYNWTLPSDSNATNFRFSITGKVRVKNFNSDVDFCMYSSYKFLSKVWQWGGEPSDPSDISGDYEIKQLLYRGYSPTKYRQ